VPDPNFQIGVKAPRRINSEPIPGFGSGVECVDFPLVGC